MHEHLTRLLLTAYGPPDDGVPDADLLARVANGRDAVAFELLVRRHAGLVWRACAAVARDRHAAEDAFQATFLALARRAGAVRRRSAAGWLYRVAGHAALKTRQRRGPTVTSAPPEVPSPALGPAELAQRAEMAAATHEELGRLPDRYREAVVLCHLHGLTQAEAAARLRLPIGTLAAHVRRGLARLRTRLVRRGVALPAVGVAGLLGGGTAPAVSPRLMSLTTGLGVGTAEPSAAVARLAAGVLSAMNRTQMTILALVTSILAAGSMTVAFGLPTSAPPPVPAPPPSADPPVAAGKAEPKAADYFERKSSLARVAQITVGWIRYAETNNAALPADIIGATGRPLLSWRVAMLPALGEDYLYSQFKLDEPWDGPANKKLLGFVPRVFRSTPDAGARGETLAKSFSGPAAATEPGKARRYPADFPDGLSNTLGVVEAGEPVPWTRPSDIPFDPNQPPQLTGPFADGVAGALMDGTGRWLRRDISPDVLRTLITRNGNDIIPGRGWGSAPPAGSLTPSEKRAADNLRVYYEAYRKNFLAQVEERARLTEELKKLGSGLFPDAPPTDQLRTPDDLLQLDRVVKYMEDLSRADQKEIVRLMRELEKRKKEQKK